MSDVAWLIERSNAGTTEWVAGLGPTRWTSDPLDVLRFAREEDARRALPAVDGSGLLVTEHEWWAPDAMDNALRDEPTGAAIEGQDVGPKP